MKRRSFIRSLAASLVFPLTSFGREVEVPRALEAKRKGPLIEYVNPADWSPGSVAVTEKTFCVTGTDPGAAAFMEHWVNAEPQLSALKREVERVMLDEIFAGSVETPFRSVPWDAKGDER